jgi:NAD(P)-dependent dehydrogenase (short-subunit alcohol dehydrogenase family)
MSLPNSPRAVVTGAGSGLGRAFCLELVQRHGRVLAADVDLAAAQETARLAGVPGAVHPVRCDVSRAEDVGALVPLAEDLLGGVDLVVNNAGVAVGGPIGTVPLEDWRWIFGVNLWGVIHGCHAFVPVFKKQGSGHVLNVASAAGLLSAPEMGPYNVTKSGVVALSETLRAELRGTGVGVTVLCPTFFRTNIAESGRTHSTDARAKQKIEKLMDRASLDANGVARRALDGVAADELFVLPHGDGRWMWRMKRLAPERFQELVPKVLAIGNAVEQAGSSPLARLRAVFGG